MVNFDIVSDIPTTNKTVFLLTDLDVPIDDFGKITNDEKIQRAMPTINYLVKTGARVVIATHLGSPIKEFDKKYSTKPIADYLNKRLHCEVNFCHTCIGEQSKRDIFRTEYGDVIVLENLLFYDEEKRCDINFARQLADGMNIYVNDSFGYSNHSYASVLGVPLFVRPTGGMTLENDVRNLDIILNNSKYFTTAVIGGRISNKVDLLYNFIERAKCIVVGVMVANSFLKAMGYNIGKSQYEQKYVEIVKDIFNKATKNDCLIFFPTDVVVVKSLTDKTMITKSISNIEDDDIIVDIGNESVGKIIDILELSKCVFCYGNVGISETVEHGGATGELFKKIADLTAKKHIFSVASGKDTVRAVNNAKYDKSFSFVSPYTDATLQYMSGKVLPGLEILKRLSKQAL